MKMRTRSVRIEGFDIAIGSDHPLCVISGPDVLEDLDSALVIARNVKSLCDRHGFGYVFKASYDKGNRAKSGSYRGPMLEKGLALLSRVRDEVGCPVLTDVHSVEEAAVAGEVVDIVQVPAFLCMQTEVVHAAARTGRVVNLKKGQFLDPWAAQSLAAKAMETGNDKILLTERGTTFGYQNLVSDIRCLPIMRSTGCPVVYDPTHIIRRPGLPASAPEGGQPEFVPHLTRAAVAAGVDALFLETHPEPRLAGCDQSSMLRLSYMPEILDQAARLHALVREWDLGIRGRDQYGFV